ncbi:MAG TPA: hypothetical protein PKV17_10450 [Aquabacterium sp.]|nr:hypothetical protein [Aquabacterium sp.]
MASPKAGKTPAPTKKTAKPAAPVKVRAGSVASKGTKPVAVKKAAITAPVAKRSEGAPSSYTPELAAKVCECIANGMSLRAIAAQPGMPAMSTVMAWLDGARPEFSEQYARAREAQADKMAEDILAIADEECTTVRASKHGMDGDADGMREVVFDATAVARNRLRVDARKWLASKLAPKKYGDKVLNEVTGANGGAIVVDSRITLVSAPSRPFDEDEA